jgi:hypothetical protein
MRKIKIKKPPGQKPQLPKGGYGFVIGNGTSRKDLNIKQLADWGKIYACNWFFQKEFRPHVLVASDEPMTKTILKKFERYSRINWFYTWFPKPGSGAKKIPTPEKFAAGPSATYIAAQTHECEKIFLIGNDFFGIDSAVDVNKPDNNGIMNNLYEGEKHYAKPPEDKDAVNGAPTFRNWQRRFQWIVKQFPNTEFYHVNPFLGKSPPRLTGFDNWHQITFDNLLDHLQNDAELVDVKVITDEDKQLAYGKNVDDERASLERQIAGQENIIFPDLLDPKQVIEIRIAAMREQKKHGDDGADVSLNLEIGEHTITVPGMHYIENGHVKWPTEDMMKMAYREELKTRPQPQPVVNLTPPPPPKKKPTQGLPPPPPIV